MQVCGRAFRVVAGALAQGTPFSQQPPAQVVVGTGAQTAERSIERRAHRRGIGGDAQAQACSVHGGDGTGAGDRGLVGGTRLTELGESRVERGSCAIEGDRVTRCGRKAGAHALRERRARSGRRRRWILAGEVGAYDLRFRVPRPRHQPTAIAIRRGLLSERTHALCVLGEARGACIVEHRARRFAGQARELLDAGDRPGECHVAERFTELERLGQRVEGEPRLSLLEPERAELLEKDRVIDGGARVSNGVTGIELGKLCALGGERGDGFVEVAGIAMNARDEGQEEPAEACFVESRGGRRRLARQRHVHVGDGKATVALAARGFVAELGETFFVASQRLVEERPVGATRTAFRLEREIHGQVHERSERVGFVAAAPADLERFAIRLHGFGVAALLLVDEPQAVDQLVDACLVLARTPERQCRERVSLRLVEMTGAVGGLREAAVKECLGFFRGEGSARRLARSVGLVRAQVVAQRQVDVAEIEVQVGTLARARPFVRERLCRLVFLQGLTEQVFLALGLLGTNAGLRQHRAHRRVHQLARQAGLFDAIGAGLENEAQRLMGVGVARVEDDRAPEPLLGGIEVERFGVRVDEPEGVRRDCVARVLRDLALVVALDLAEPARTGVGVDQAAMGLHHARVVLDQADEGSDGALGIAPFDLGLALLDGGPHEALARQLVGALGLRHLALDQAVLLERLVPASGGVREAREPEACLGHLLAIRRELGGNAAVDLLGALGSARVRVCLAHFEERPRR